MMWLTGLIAAVLVLAGAYVAVRYKATPQASSREAATRARLAAAIDADQAVTGTVIARVQGGFTVDIGVHALLPTSHVSLDPDGPTTDLVGQTVQVKILVFERKGGPVVVSRRLVLQEERQARRTVTQRTLAVGQTVSARITHTTPFGVFVDLGGVPGMVHNTQMGAPGGQPPSLVVGQHIQVDVLEIMEGSKPVRLRLLDDLRVPAPAR